MKSSKRDAFIALATRIMLLPTISVYAQPFWVEQGPGPMLTPFGWGEQSGAVQAIAADPINPNRIFIATVNGGIWRTDNGMAARPTWTNRTDQMPSLSMGAIAFNPLDPNHNTLFAGCSRDSSYFNVGSLSSGLLKTTDGGNSWIEIARETFSGNVVTRILPTTVMMPSGQVILVATSSRNIFRSQFVGDPNCLGLWRSQDGGRTWCAVTVNVFGHPPIDVTDLVADPSHPQRIFCALNDFVGDGVYRSEDAGVTWMRTAAPVGRLRLAISPTTDSLGRHWLYVSRLGGSIYCSKDNGSQWTELDLPPGNTHFGGFVCVSRSAPHIIFTVDDFNRRWRWDATKPSGAQWFALPELHADGRDCVVSADPNTLFQSDDGGIYRLKNALSSSPSWESAVGTLRVTEFYSTAYDSLNHVVVGGSQDNGVPEQTTANDYLWSINYFPQYDGMAALCESTSLPGHSIRYIGPANPLTDFHRITHDNQHRLISDEGVATRVWGSGNSIIQLDPAAGGEWIVPMLLNAVAPTQMVINANGFLYESFDRGDNVFQLGRGPLMSSENRVGSVNSCITYTMAGAWAYGGTAFGVPNPDVLYLGIGSTLRVRTIGNGLPQVRSSYPGTCIRSVTLDPNDWRRAYVLDSNQRVWRTTDAADSDGGWQQVTSNLRDLPMDPHIIVALSASSLAGHEALVVAGKGGIFFASYPCNGSPNAWQPLGNNFPNVIVSSFQYDSRDDVFVAGTIGRGAWTLPNAKSRVFAGNCFVTGPILTVGPSGQFRTVRDAYNFAGDCNCNVIRITTGTYHEAPITFNLNKRVRLESQGGAVTINR